MTQVYFIRPVGAKGPVKIGFAANVAKRFRGIDACSPTPLEIAATIEGDRRLELRFHALFAEQHIRFEWFDWTATLESVIARIRAGDFNIDTLPAPRGVQQSASAREWHRQRVQELQTT